MDSIMSNEKKFSSQQELLDYFKMGSMEELKEFLIKDMGMIKALPSGHQIDDEVNLCFGDTGTLKSCRIIKVHFSESKVLYDVSIPVICEDLENKVHTAYTRLYNVDSAFVTAL